MSLHVNGCGREPPRRSALKLLRPRLLRLQAVLAELVDRGRPPLLRLAWRLIDAVEEVAGFVAELAGRWSTRAAAPLLLSPHEAMADEHRRLQANLDAARSWFDLAAAAEVDGAIGRLDLAERELDAFQQQARSCCAVRREARTWEGRVIEMVVPRRPIRPPRPQGSFQDYRILDEVLALRRRVEEVEDARRCASWTRQCA